MIRCEAPNCKMRAYNLTKEQLKLAQNNYIVSFHKFPDDPEQRNAWVEAAEKKDWKPPEDGSLCSLHFRDDCFNENNELYDHALPTIFFDDFRSHIRGIVKEFDLECGLSDNEPEKDEKADENVANSSAEIIEYRISSEDDDENIVECEEVMINPDEPKAGIEDITILESNEVTTEPAKKPPVEPTKPIYKPGPSSSKLKNTTNKPAFSLKNLFHKKTVETPKVSSIPQSSADDDDIVCLDHIKKPSVGTSKPLDSIASSITKKVPPIPITTSDVQHQTTEITTVKQLPPISNIASGLQPLTAETTNKLFDLVKPSSFTKFSVLEPASKSLVMQLLNIVKTANSRNEIHGSNAVAPSTYIITTKQEAKDEVIKQPTVMESAVIVQTIINLVKDIKLGIYKKIDNISIICGSPAIFFIRNVTVKNCDPNMNSAYVITAENLLPHLYKLQSSTSTNTSVRLTTQRTLVKQPMPIESKIISSASVSELLRGNTQREQASSTAAPVFQDIITSAVHSSAADSRTMPSQNNVLCVNTNLKSQMTTTASAPAGTKFSFTSTTSRVQVINKSGSTIGASNTKTNFVTIPSTQSKPSTSGTLKLTSSSIQKSPLNQAPVARVIPSTLTTSVVNSTLTSTASNFTTPSVSFSTNSKLRPNASTLKTTYYSPSSPQMQIRSKPVQIQHTVPAQTLKSSPIVIPSTSIRSLIQSHSLPTKSSSQPAKAYQASVVNQNITTVQRSPSPEFIFKPIQAETFNTRLTKSPETLYPCSPIPSTSREIPSQKRKWGEEVEDDDGIIVEYNPNHEFDDREYIYEQEKEIEAVEENILQKERDINNLKKRIAYLKKRLSTMKNPHDVKTDEQLVEEILSKYIDSDGVQFFIGQMKVSGKTYTQFRWSEEDKLFALSLLYKNPIEYNILFQKYTLPSDKTLNKFVTRIKKAEMGESGTAN